MPGLNGLELQRLLVAGGHQIPIMRDLRDRALIATLTYSFARINAALKI